MTADSAPTPPAPPSPPSSQTMPPPSPASLRQRPTLAHGAVRYTVAAVAIVVVFLGIHWFVDRRSHSISEDAFIEAHIINLAPQTVSGRIVRFLVDENDRVEQGQMLAEIEPVNYQDQVDQARSKLALADADLKRQEAALAKLKNQVPLQVEVAKQTLAVARNDAAKARDSLELTTDEVNKTIDETKASVEAATADLTLAKQEYDRYTQLAAEDATPKRKSDEVTRAHDSAKAQLRVADARLARAEAARTRISVARHDLESAQTAVMKAESSLGLAETGYDEIRELELTVELKREMVKEAQVALATGEHQLGFTQIRAPFPGVVVKRYRSLGDIVAAGVPLLSMYNPELLYVTVNLEETRLRGVAPGNAVTLDVDAFDRPFKGRVVWLNKSTGAEFALMPRNVVAGEFTKVVQRVPVRIWIERDDRWPQLRAGLSARVTIEHGDGDLQWALQAAKDMARVEMQYNQPMK